MSDNLSRLEDRVKSLMKAINQQEINVGARRGTMVTESSVLIDGKTYNAIAGTQVSMYPGARVWCQLASSSTAVIIGA